MNDLTLVYHDPENGIIWHAFRKDDGEFGYEFQEGANAPWLRASPMTVPDHVKQKLLAWAEQDVDSALTGVLRFMAEWNGQASMESLCELEDEIAKALGVPQGSDGWNWSAVHDRVLTTKRRTEIVEPEPDPNAPFTGDSMADYNLWMDRMLANQQLPPTEQTQGIRHHPVEACDGFPCVFHDPSSHPMVSWPIMLRASGLIERTCTHGVGHPDPDSVQYFERQGTLGMGVHGCDGCCK